MERLIAVAERVAPFVWDVVREDAALLRQALEEAGLAASVAVRIEPASSSSRMDVTFLLAEGE